MASSRDISDGIGFDNALYRVDGTTSILGHIDASRLRPRDLFYGARCCPYFAIEYQISSLAASHLLRPFCTRNICVPLGIYNVAKAIEQKICR